MAVKIRMFFDPAFKSKNSLQRSKFSYLLRPIQTWIYCQNPSRGHLWVRSCVHIPNRKWFIINRISLWIMFLAKKCQRITLWNNIFFQLFETCLSSSQRYTYRVLQTIQMKLVLLCAWAEPAVLGRTKTALKFKYEIWIG